MQRLILIGGGHAHLFVLQAIARAKPADLHITLITPGEWQYYSGMLPGWIAGQYPLDACRIDLRPLVQTASAQWIDSSVQHIDAQARHITLQNGETHGFDLLSIDIGSETRTDTLTPLGDRLLTIKPLTAFQTAWQHVLARVKAQPDFRLAIVGGGAAGVELALAMQQALQPLSDSAQISLITGQNGLLPQHNEGVRRKTHRALQAAGIVLIAQSARGLPNALQLADGSTLRVDQVIAATGAQPPNWLRHCHLTLDAEGYIAVDACHRNLQHPHIFAAGDICSRSDVALARSGVHAVRAGPVLAANLLAALAGKPCRPFYPRKHSLYLLSCGNGRAIASWGPFSASGAWVWRWKDRIDRNFIRRFSTRATE